MINAYIIDEIMKKLLIAGVIINSLVCGFSGYTFKMYFDTKHTPNVNKDPFNMENITEVKDVPIDGSSPKDYSILENIQYASGYLKNNRNWKAITTGDVKSNAGVNVTQQVYNTRIVNQDYMYQEAISYSSLVKVATQKFYNSEKVFIKNGNPKSLNEINWNNNVSPVTYEYIYTNYGFSPDQLNSYYYAEESILNSSSMEEIDGNYVLHVDLNEIGAINSRREVVTMGGALDNPNYTMIHADIKITPDWKVLSIDVNENYSIKKNIGLGVVTATCNSVLSETFEYNQYISDSVISYYKGFFDAGTSDQISDNENKTPLTYLQSMSSIVASKSTFDIDLNLNNDQNFHGQIELNLKNDQEVNINLEDKYFIKYQNGNVFSSLDGINISLDEKYINYAMSKFIDKFSNTNKKFLQDSNQTTPSDINLDVDELLNAIMEGMTLEINDNVAIVNILASSQGIELDVDLSFDEKDQELLAIDGSIKYGETTVGVNIDASNNFQGKDITDLEFNDLSNSTWIIDQALGMSEAKGYQLDGNYIYKNIEFDIKTLVSTKGDISSEISFGWINETLKKHLSFTKISDTYYLEYGNLKVKANQNSILSVLKNILELYNNGEDNLPAKDVIDGIGLSQFTIGDFLTDEKGNLILKMTVFGNEYNAILKESVNEGFILNIKELGLTFDVIKYQGEIATPDQKVNYLDENDFEYVKDLILKLKDKLSSSSFSLEGKTKLNKQVNLNVNYSFQKDQDNYLFNIVSNGDFNFDLNVYLKGNTIYVDAKYDFVSLSFTFEKDDFNSFTKTIYRTLCDYYGFDFETELNRLIDELFEKQNIKVEEILGYIIDANIENEIQISLDENNNVVIKYLDDRELVISKDNEDILFNIDYLGGTSYLNVNSDKLDYHINSETIYTPIRNIKYASFMLDAYLDIKSFSGYQIRGEIKYKEITLDVDVNYDKQNNIEGIISLKNGENIKDIKVVRDSNILYLEHGNIKVQLTDGELEEGINKILELTNIDQSQKDINKEIIIEFIKELNLFVESISLEESKVITSLKINNSIYSLSLGYKNKEVTLSCDNELFDLSFVVNEYKDSVVTPTGEFITYDELNELVNNILEIKDQIIRENYKISYSYKNNEEISVTGTYSQRGKEYQANLVTIVKGEEISVNVVVKDNKMYLDMNYQGIMVTLEMKLEDINGLYSDIYALVEKNYGDKINVNVEITQEKVIEVIKQIISNDYDKKVNVEVNNGFNVSYDTYKGCISKNKVSYQDGVNNLTLEMVENTDTYEVRSDISYCQIDGLDSAYELITALKEIATFSGYQIQGSFEVDSILVKLTGLYDQNDNIELVFDINYLGHVHTLKINYIDNQAYVMFGNVKMSLSRDELVKYIDEIIFMMNIESDNSSLNENVDLKNKIISLIKTSNLSLSQINVTTNSVSSLISINNQNYSFKIEYVNDVLAVTCLDFYQITLNLSNYTDVIPNINVDNTFITAETIEYFREIVSSINNDVKNNHLGVDISLIIDENNTLSGNVKYIGVNEIYSTFSLVGTYQVDVEIYKLNDWVYIDVYYDNYHMSIKYCMEDNQFLIISLENSFKLIDEKFNLGLYDQIFNKSNTNNQSTLIDYQTIINYIKDFLSGNYENTIKFNKVDNKYQLTYDQYQIVVSKEPAISIDLSYKGYQLNSVVNSNFEFSRIIDSSKYTLININQDFSFITKKVLEIMDYSGYLVSFDFVIDKMDINAVLRIDNAKNISIDLTILESEYSHLMYITYIGSTVYFEYGNIKAVLTIDEFKQLIKDIDSLIGKNNQTTLANSSTSVEKSLIIINDFVKALTVENNQLLLDLVYEKNSYHLSLCETEFGIAFNSESYELTGLVQDYTQVIAIPDSSKYLAYDDIKVVIDYCVEARNYFYLDKGYLSLDGVFTLSGTNYKISADAKYDYVVKENAKLTITMTIDVQKSDYTWKQLFTGTISYQNNFVYLHNVMYNELIGLNVYFDKTDTAKAIDVILTKLAQGPFNNDKYGLNLELMKMIKNILELDPSVILSFDDSNAFDKNETDSVKQTINLIKTILSFRLNESAMIDVVDGNVELSYSDYFSGTISHYIDENSKSLIQINGSGDMDSTKSYDFVVKFKNYEEFTINTEGCTNLKDLEILSNGVMNTINALKYDVSGSLNLNIIGIVKIGMSIDSALIELDENQNASGYIKITTDANSLITEGKKLLNAKSDGGVRGDKIISYIHLTKNGDVYCRREYESWVENGKIFGIVKYADTYVYETKYYESQQTFANDFLNAFIWLTKFDKSFIDKFSGASMKGTKKDNAISSYTVSEDKLSYQLGFNLGCIASIFDDGSTIDLKLKQDGQEYYLNSLTLDVSIYKVLTANGTFTLNSYGQDLNYESMPTLEEMTREEIVRI